MNSPGEKWARNLFFVALIFSGIMAWFGLSSIPLEERQAVQRARQRAETAAAELDRRVAGQLEALRQRWMDEFQRSADSEDFEEQAQRLQAWARDHMELGIVFAFAEDDQLILPSVRVDPSPQALEASDARRLKEFLTDADEARRNKDEFWAQHLIQEAKSLFPQDIAQVQILRRLASWSRQRRDRSQLLRHLEELYAEYPEARVQPKQPLALTLWPELAALRLELGSEQRPPWRPLIRLGRALARNRWGLDDDSLKALSDSNHARLRAMEPKLPNSALPDFHRDLAQLFELQEFFHIFPNRAAPDIRQIIEIDPAQALESVMVEVKALGQTSIYCARPWRAEPFSPVLGVQIDLDSLKSFIENEIEVLSAAYESRLAVSDGSRLLTGDAELWQQREDQAGRSMDASVSHWRVLARPSDPDRPRRESRRKWLIYGILVGSCALVIMGAAWLTMKSVEHQLMLAQMRTQLVRNVSHELRTPVASILMLAEILQEDRLPREREKNYFDRIVGQSKRLATLVEKVLSLSQIEQGKRQLELQVEALEPCCRQIVDQFKASEEGRDRDIDFHSEVGEGLVKIDRDALDQVLTNLLSNAVKYGGDGKIVVTLEDLGRSLQVSVRDHGPGVSEDLKKQLFTPFFRGRYENSSVSGVGIGLTIVQQLVQLMGGQVSLDSKVQGPGCRFLVRFARHYT